MKAWKVFENDSLFRHSNETLTLDEQRKIAILRMYKIIELKLFPYDELISNPKLVSIIIVLQFDYLNCILCYTFIRVLQKL